MRASVSGVAAAALFVIIAAAAAVAAVEPVGGTALAVSEAGIASRALLHAGHADAELDAADGDSATADVRPLAAVYLILSVTRVMAADQTDDMMALSAPCFAMLDMSQPSAFRSWMVLRPQVLLRRRSPPRDCER